MVTDAASTDKACLFASSFVLVRSVTNQQAGFAGITPMLQDKTP